MLKVQYELCKVGTNRYARRGIPEYEKHKRLRYKAKDARAQGQRCRSSRVKIPEIRHRLYCSMSAFQSKIPSRTKGQDERSTSALIEALTPKELLTVKILDEVISP